MRLRSLALMGLFGCALLLGACGEEDDGGPEGPNPDVFVGAYNGTVTLSGGAGSETYTGDIQIQRGSTVDLVVSFLDARNLRATITGANSFRIDEQQTNLTDAWGQAFSATVTGNGTVTGGAITMNGQFSSANGVMSFTVNGNKL